MKRVMIISVLLLSTMVFAETVKTVEAPVRSAKLYLNGGEIVRQGKIAVDAPGDYTLQIPKVLAEDTSQTIITVEGAVLMNQRVEVRPKSHEASELMIRLDEENTKLVMLEDELKQLSLVVESLSEVLTRDSNKLDDVMTKIATLRPRINQLRKDQGAQARLVNQLRAQLRDVNEKTPPVDKYYVLQLHADKSAEINISIVEYSNAVAWHATSQADLDTELHQIKLNAYANIKQNTALDWENVHISLAIVPTDYIDKPTFFTKMVGFNNKKVERKFLSLESSASETSVKQYESAVGEVALVENNVPNITSVGQDFQVDLPGTYSLTHGESSVQMRYWQATLKAENYSAIYEWLPNEALVIAEWNQPKSINFLPGVIRILRDGNRVGEMRIRDIWTGNSKISMSFGKDTDLEVKQTSVPNFTDVTGIINGKKIQEVREKITVHSRASEGKDVRFYGQLPVSTEKEITVKPKWNVRPEVENVDDHAGVAQWQRVLKRDENWEIIFGYDIYYPQDRDINIGLF